MKILFSIPVHEKTEVIVDQIVNFKHFLDDPILLLHISSKFDWDNSSMSRHNFLDIVENMPNVYINPVSYDTGDSNIIHVHNENFKYAYMNIDFDYFCLSASNVLFVKRGIERVIPRFEAGFQRISIEEYPKWNQLIISEKDDDLARILSNLKLDKIYGSQCEGTFYKRELFKTMVEHIEREYDFRTYKLKYAREEVYYPTIASQLVTPDKTNKVPFTYIDWSLGNNYGYLRHINFKTVLSLSNNKPLGGRDTSPLFSVKRVDREINNELRVYIRNLGNYKLTVEQLTGIRVLDNLSFVSAMRFKFSNLKLNLKIAVNSVRYVLFLWKKYQFTKTGVD